MAKTLALVFGVVFVLVGIAGFVPNPLVGMEGIFETDAMHNIVHLLFGIILLGVVFGAKQKSALALKVLGIVYLVLAVLGFLMVPQGGMLLGLVHTNQADHVLHVILGIVLVAAGFMGGAKPPAAAPMNNGMTSGN